jgi:hypothetical protein
MLRPPASPVYRRIGIAIVVPFDDVRYIDLPADLYAGSGTDISRLLNVPYTFVDSIEMVKSMLDALPTSKSDVPLPSMDLEGLDLGKRRGETYLLQIYDSHSHRLYIVDICTLGRLAFPTPASDGKTRLKTVLESAEVPKLFCDARGDSYTLFRELQICLRGVKDVPNTEIAPRRDPTGRQRRSGLTPLINTLSGLPEEEMRRATFSSAFVLFAETLLCMRVLTCSICTGSTLSLSQGCRKSG